MVLGTLITLPWLITLFGMEALREILWGWTFRWAIFAGVLFNRLRIAALLDLFVACALLFIAAAAALAKKYNINYESTAYIHKRMIWESKDAKIYICLLNFMKQCKIRPICKNKNIFSGCKQMQIYLILY